MKLVRIAARVGRVGLVSVLLAWAVTMSAVAMAAETITVVYRTVGNNEVAWMNERIEAFQKTHPEYEVSLVGVPGAEFLDKIKVMLATGQAVDAIGWWNDEFIHSTHEEGLFVDLNTLIERDRDISISNYFPAAISASIIDDELVVLPLNVDVGLLMYDPDVYEEAGLRQPAELASEGGWTWDVFLAYAKSVTRSDWGDGVPQRFGYQPGWVPWVPNWGSWIASNGGAILDEETGEFLMARPAAVEALEFWTDLKNVHNVWGGDILQGTAAMRHTPLATAGEASVRGMRLSAVMNPSKESGSNAAHYLIASGISLLQRGNVDASWELLKFLSSDESLRMLAQSTKRLPPVRQLVGTWIEIFQRDADGAQQVINAIQTARALPYTNSSIPVSILLNQYIRPAVDRVVAGGESAQAAMTSTQEQIASYMNQLVR